MSNIRSEFGNLKGHQVETARKTLKVLRIGTMEEKHVEYKMVFVRIKK